MLGGTGKQGIEGTCKQELEGTGRRREEGTGMKETTDKEPAGTGRRNFPMISGELRIEDFKILGRLFMHLEGVQATKSRYIFNHK